MCMQVLNDKRPFGGTVYGGISTELAPLHGVMALSHVDVRLQMKVAQALFNYTIYVPPGTYVYMRLLNWPLVVYFSQIDTF